MKKTIILLLTIINTFALLADGLIIPEGDTYPGDFLRNKSTSIEVKINGLIAETIVYQEFENESDEAITGVYSFPLPMNARTTRLMYSKGDTLIDAKLKVIAQVQNPGTGEGGVTAHINKYMGTNALRFKLKNIGAHSITVIRLHYISTLNHVGGKAWYHYPLDLSEFVTQPLDYLKIRVQVNSNQEIVDFDMPNNPDFYIKEHTTNALDLSYFTPKKYAAQDVTFEYQVNNGELNVDLYSWKPDSADGYFTMMGYPQKAKIGSKIQHKIMFMLCNSTTMAGLKLDQSKLAISRCLDQLSSTDFFNIMVFNSSNSTWNTTYMPATRANITAAKNYIQSVNSTYGNMLDRALENAFKTVTSNDVLTSFVVFTDGKGTIDPYEAEELNIHKTGIFLLSIGNDYDRSRLETLAGLNYGFVSYITEESNLTNEMVNLFSKISTPLYKDVNIDFLNPLVHDMYPAKFPAIFSNGDFIVSGRYKSPGSAQISLTGLDILGIQSFPFNVNFSYNPNENWEFCRNLWVKNAVDHLEAQILIYGEEDSLKNKLIELSLANNMRCRFTSYEEDSVYMGSDDKIFGEIGSGIDITFSGSMEENATTQIVKVNPVPLKQNSIITIHIDEVNASQSKIIKVYNVFGEMVHMINLSGLSAGTFDVSLAALLSNDLKGYFVVTLEIGGKIIDAENVVILK